MTPGTTWTEVQVDAAGYMDSVPAPAPRVAGATVTEDYFMDILMEYGQTITMFFAPPGPDTWTEASVAAASYTEKTVASTSWTEGTL